MKGHNHWCAVGSNITSSVDCKRINPRLYVIRENILLWGKPDRYVGIASLLWIRSLHIFWSTHHRMTIMALPMHHVYILVSILIPVGAICIFASYMIFLYDPERPTCLRLPQWSVTSKQTQSPQLNQGAATHGHPVCIQHPDHTISVGLSSGDQQVWLLPHQRTYCSCKGGICC